MNLIFFLKEEEIDSCFRRNDINTPEQVSREKALEAIKLIQDNLSTCISPLPNVGGLMNQARTIGGG